MKETIQRAKLEVLFNLIDTKLSKIAELESEIEEIYFQIDEVKEELAEFDNV